MNAPADSSDSPTGIETLDPFNDERVTGLFFPGGGRQELLEQVIDLLRSGPSLLCLYGDQGVGKHFFTDHLISQLDDELFEVAMVNGETMNIAHGVLHACTKAWHSRQPLELSNFREKVVAVASDANLESKVLVCVMRHSQFLDQQTVDMVAELLASCEGLPVKFLLVADVTELSQAPQLKELANKVPDHVLLEMTPLGKRATSDYLHYRLRTAGMGQVFFSESQVQQIYNRSMGNIDLVNQVAKGKLQECMPKPTPRAVPSAAPEQEQFKLPQKHLVALGVVALLLIVVFFAGSGADEPQTPAADPTAENPVADVVTVKPEVSPFLPDEEQADAQEASEEVALKQAEAEAVLEPDPVESNTVASDSVVADDAPGEEPQQAAMAPTPVPDPVPEQTDVGAERTAWLKTLPPENYTVQLLGAKELATVRRFMAIYPSLQGVVYYKTVRQGQPWYVVVQGNYTSHDAAKTATLQYPSELRKQGPWIRKLEAIQKEL